MLTLITTSFISGVGIPGLFIFMRLLLNPAGNISVCPILLILFSVMIMIRP